MNTSLLARAATAALICSIAGVAHAGDGPGTAAEAAALVRRGVAFVKANGKDKGYAELSNRSGLFVDRDLYLVVYGLDGTVRAHGGDEKMIGRSLIELKDADGRAFVKERVEMAQSKPKFWQDYRLANPVSKKIEAKITYCEKLDDAVVCGGIDK